MGMEGLLNRFNKEYVKLHETYEDNFWDSYMGDSSVNAAMDEAKNKLNDWKSDSANMKAVQEAIANETDEKLIKRGKYWEHFFSLYQTPEELKPLRQQIQDLETQMHEKLTNYQRGYTDPHTNERVTSSKHGVLLTMASNPDEAVRKACFEGMQEGAPLLVEEYIQLVGLRNEYAKALGFKNFYYYKAQLEERMSADTIFNIFDTFYEKTKGCLQKIRDLEKEKPGLRNPWNMTYLLSGDFIKREEKYFALDKVLLRWGQSFRNLGLTYNNARLKLDLLFRQGKHDNGFCHYPMPVAWIDGVKTDYRCNFTCNALPGKIGSGLQTEITLFHEGGHAADRARANQEDVCLNTEYPPASTTWAETHSMFCDTISSSIEWRSRYAQAHDGELYPWDLYEEKVRALRITAPKMMLGIADVLDFEKNIYAAEHLTRESIIALAKDLSDKYNDFEQPYLWALTVPHIYSWESACSYHGYGLATLGLTQRRSYFYKKYGYIVDNPKVGEEMKKAWEPGAAYSFEESIRRATGEDLNPQAYIDEIIMDTEALLARSKQRIKDLENVPLNTSPVNLDAHITLAHGKKTISTNDVSFEDMCEKFGKFIKTM